MVDNAKADGNPVHVPADWSVPLPTWLESKDRINEQLERAKKGTLTLAEKSVLWAEKEQVSSHTGTTLAKLG